jgi:hypothetical protein
MSMLPDLPGWHSRQVQGLGVLLLAGAARAGRVLIIRPARSVADVAAAGDEVQ